MKFIKINGLSIHFSDTGSPDGAVLVFINSLGTDFRVWERVSREFESRFRVIQYDKRGHGLSDAPPAPYVLQDHIDDLSVLLETLNVRKSVVCGVSVGGLIAQGYCVQHADRVEALVLCNTAARIGTDELWNNRIKQVEDQGIEAIAESVLERWFTTETLARNDAELSGRRNMLVRTTVDGYAGTGAAIRDTDFSNVTASIAVPSLVVVGEEDGATPPEVVRGLADLITGSRFEVIEGAGHLPMVEQPGVLVGHMTSFFREHGIG